MLLAACTSSDISENETMAAVSENVPAETQEPEKEPLFPASLPEDLNFEGRAFTIYVPSAYNRKFYAGDEE